MLLLCTTPATAVVQGQDGYYVARSYEDARAQATAAGVSPDTPLSQDEDVLDTWFRLGLLLFFKKISSAALSSLSYSITSAHIHNLMWITISFTSCYEQF
jgi:hypothetical protein